MPAILALNDIAVFVLVPVFKSAHINIVSGKYDVIYRKLFAGMGNLFAISGNLRCPNIPAGILSLPRSLWNTIAIASLKRLKYIQFVAVNRKIALYILSRRGVLYISILAFKQT